MAEDKPQTELGDNFETAPEGTTRTVYHDTQPAAGTSFTDEEVKKSMDDRATQLNARGIKEPGVNAPLPEEKVIIETETDTTGEKTTGDAAAKITSSTAPAAKTSQPAQSTTGQAAPSKSEG